MSHVLTSSERKTVRVDCFRYDPERDQEPRFETYAVPLSGETRVIDCLQYIREHLDPSLAFFINCKRGTCARCSMRINGKVRLACMTIVDGDIRVEPVKRDDVIRDLWLRTT